MDQTGNKKPVHYKTNIDSEIDFTIDEANIKKDTDSMKRSRKTTKLHLLKTKKGKMILLVVVIVVIGLVIYFAQSGNTKKTANIADLRTKTVPKSDLVPSTLTGVPVSPSLNKIPVTGVMVENDIAARPQAGLSSAGVVFEALTEGGISRFLALYQNTAPNNVGPIRSARPYFVEWDLGFNAPYAHVGGSPLALSDITAWGVKDLNQFYNGNYYHRISSRLAPHNVYTSIADLNQLEQSKGYTSYNFQGFPRQKADPAKKPTVTNINMALSYGAYNVSYSYDSQTNSYNRSQGGVPMIDANNNQQISPNVVIAIVVPETQGPLDASNAYYSDYHVIGSGNAYVFQDGRVYQGQWSKTSRNAQMTFTSNNGQILRLDPGQTWITALTTSSQLTYN